MRHVDESSGGGRKGLKDDGQEDDSEQAPSPASQHDPWITTHSGSPLAVLAVDIWQQLEAARGPTSRKPRGDAAERRKAIVRNLLANLTLLTLRHPKDHRLAISADKQAMTRYDRPDLPREPLLQAVREMESHGLVLLYPGVSRKLRTTITPTEGLRSMLAYAGASLEQIDRAPGGETIILKADVGRRRPKLLINYRDNPEADRLRAEMATINAALNAADIRLDGERQEPIHLVRIFLIETGDAPHTFHRHGRLFRGHWQHVRREKRAGLTIDGERLAELDYKAAYVQLAYALNGVPLPQGDPYAVAGLEEHRAGVKKAMASLFFRSGPMERLSGELRDLLPVGWTARRVEEAVAAHHPAIAPLFGSGIGATLAHTESSILVAVLLRLIREGVAALPLHDCLLVSQRHKAAALAAMHEESARIVGFVLPVEEKALAA
ncbi:hypothetical protein WHT83_02565 [Aminobacter sp. P9b]|uniref:hypothetical protein n=1 Tax=Aminobacter sp. P9b TaxID=3133697 RepID=UPI003255F6A5